MKDCRWHTLSSPIAIRARGRLPSFTTGVPAVISPWTAVAFNQVPDSANEIHGDELAKEYGFAGGLVPGVTVSAYLAHPAVESWGLDWLRRGGAHVRVASPLYDGETFDVRITAQSAAAYCAELVRPGDAVSANAELWLADTLPLAPARRGDRIAGNDEGALSLIHI